MTTNQPITSSRIACLAAAVALLIAVAGPRSVLADLTADEIMAASNDAMSKPIKYRTVNGQLESVVYRKTLANGTVASLTEAGPPLNTIRLKYGETNFELFPTKHLAINKHLIKENIVKQAQSAASQRKNPSARTSLRLVGTVEHDGRQCYEIESILPTDVIAAVAKTMPNVSTAMVPAKTRQLIDKKSYLLVLRESILADGTSTSKIEYKDISPQPDLTDDFFQVPTGFEVRTPATSEEYVVMVSDVLVPTLAAQEFKPMPVPPLRQPPKLERRKFATGSREDFVRAHNKATVAAAAKSPGRHWLAVLANVVVLAVLAAVVATRHMRRVRARAT